MCGTPQNPWEGPRHADADHPGMPWVAESLASGLGASSADGVDAWFAAQPADATVLFVDDERTPPPEALADGPVVVARTTACAIRYLYSVSEPGKVVVWFDHDMDTDTLGADVGVRVSRWLAWRHVSRLWVPVSRAYVHTSNPEGGRSIMSDLSAAGVPAARVPPPATARR